AIAAPRKTPLDAALLLIATTVLALVSLMATAASKDPLFQFQGWIFTGAFTAAAFALTAGISGGAIFSDPNRYSGGVIKAGVIATLFWGAAGMLVGCVIAAQLAWPRLFYFPDYGFLNFGRLRPLHTSAVIFAFGGNALICTSLWVVQRTCRARLWGGLA